MAHLPARSSCHPCTVSPLVPLPPRESWQVAASTCWHVGSRLHQGAPALLDVTPLPDHHRSDPRDEEEADHRVAELAEVEPLEPLPDGALERQLVGDDLEYLDAADHQRHGHGKARDGDVVVN